MGSVSRAANGLQAGHTGALAMLVVGLSLMGLTYGPLGTVMSELFPTAVRYTGSSLAFSIAGILGASLTPYIATKLAPAYGLQYVAYYLSAGSPHHHRLARDPRDKERGFQRRDSSTLGSRAPINALSVTSHGNNG